MLKNWSLPFPPFFPLHEVSLGRREFFFPFFGTPPPSPPLPLRVEKRGKGFLLFLFFFSWGMRYVIKEFPPPPFRDFNFPFFPSYNMVRIPFFLFLQRSIEGLSLFFLFGLLLSPFPLKYGEEILSLSPFPHGEKNRFSFYGFPFPFSPFPNGILSGLPLFFFFSPNCGGTFPFVIPFSLPLSQFSTERSPFFFFFSLRRGLNNGETPLII